LNSSNQPSVIRGDFFDEVVVGERIDIFAAEFAGQQKAVNVSLHEGPRNRVGKVVQPVALVAMRLNRGSQCSRTFPYMFDFFAHRVIRSAQ